MSESERRVWNQQLRRQGRRVPGGSSRKFSFKTVDGNDGDDVDDNDDYGEGSEVETNREMQQGEVPVSYTHLTLPTKA